MLSVSPIDKERVSQRCIVKMDLQCVYYYKSGKGVDVIWEIAPREISSTPNGGYLPVPIALGERL